jgi:hypothetical protein
LEVTVLGFELLYICFVSSHVHTPEQNEEILSQSPLWMVLITRHFISGNNTEFLQMKVKVTYTWNKPL